MSWQGNSRRKHPIFRANRVQFSYAAAIAAYLSVYTLILSAATLAPSYLRVIRNPESMSLTDAAELVLFGNRVWPIAIILILGFCLHSLTMSHRVFGPLVRVQHEAAKIGAGDLRRRLRFRRGDYLSKTRDALNDMVENLDVRMAKVQEAREQCAERLAELEHLVADAGLEGHQHRIQALKNAHQELGATLAVFQTTAGRETAGGGKWSIDRAQPAPGDVPPESLDRAA